MSPLQHNKEKDCVCVCVCMFPLWRKSNVIAKTISLNKSKNVDINGEDARNSNKKKESNISAVFWVL